MKSALTKNDIDGQEIRRISQTPFVEIEGVMVCRVFIELTNGILFELVDAEQREKYGIQQTEERTDLIPVQFPGDTPSQIGETVKTLIISNYLPVIGVQLDSGEILSLLLDLPNAVRPFLFDIAPHYSGDIFSYWDRQLIE